MTRSKPLPSRLYRYASLQGQHAQWAQEVIESHGIYFAAPSMFNDPFDSKIVADLLTPQETLRKCEHAAINIENTMRAAIVELQAATKHPNLSAEEYDTVRGRIGGSCDSAQDAHEQIEAIHSRIRSTRAWLADILRQVDEVQDKLYKVGVLCLCETPDNMLMWSHYADCHRGICFEFDTQYEPFLSAVDVRYQKSCPGLEDYREVMLTKMLDWQYEREWRVLSRPVERGGSGVRKFPAEALVGVICGCKMEESVRYKVESWTARGIVSLKRAIVSRGTYALEIQ